MGKREWNECAITERQPLALSRSLWIDGKSALSHCKVGITSPQLAVPEIPSMGTQINAHINMQNHIQSSANKVSQTVQTRDKRALPLVNCPTS